MPLKTSLFVDLIAKSTTIECEALVAFWNQFVTALVSISIFEIFPGIAIRSLIFYANRDLFKFKNCLPYI